MKFVLATLLLALAWWAAPSAAAEDAPPGGMPHHSMMAGGSAEEHEAMMKEMQARQEKLDALVAAMDAAQGSERVDAIAAVVRELVAQHEAMTEHMQKMHERRMPSMRQGGGATPPATSPGTSP